MLLGRDSLTCGAQPDRPPQALLSSSLCSAGNTGAKTRTRKGGMPLERRVG